MNRNTLYCCVLAIKQDSSCIGIRMLRNGSLKIKVSVKYLNLSFKWASYTLQLINYQQYSIVNTVVVGFYNLMNALILQFKFTLILTVKA